MSTKKTINKFDFEASLKRLEEIVSVMEKGGVELEKSLALFAEGVTLTKECQGALNTASQQVKILTGKTLSNFNQDDNED